MKLPPKWVTVMGLVIAGAAVVIDPANSPMLVALFGANAATKLAAIGAFISAMGRALISPKPAD